MSNSIRGISPAISSQVGQTGTLGTSAQVPESIQAPSTAAVDSADVARAEALLAAISAAAGTVPEVDQARVSELQQQLRSGTYQISPGQIAEKMAEIEALLVH